MTKMNLRSEFERAVRSVFDDDEFYIGMRSYCYDDRDKQTLINFIRLGDNVDTRTVAYLALDLANKRDKKTGSKPY